MIHFHRFFLAWHRKIGIVIALFVVLLSITGLLLNHTDRLHLAKININQKWILNWYHIRADIIFQHFETPHFQATVVAQQLYINQRLIDIKASTLLGIATQNETWIILLKDQLLLFNQATELLENLTIDDGLPENITKISVEHHQLYLTDDQSIYTFDLETLESNRLTSSKKPLNWSIPQKVPNKLMAFFVKKMNPKGLPLERIILDLHSGRFFGQFGVYFIDMVAILMLFLSFSGMYMWFKRLTKRR